MIVDLSNAASAIYGQKRRGFEDMKHFKIAALPMALLAVAGLPGIAGAQDAPDISGVWTWYVEPGSNPFAMPSAPDLPFTADAQAKADEYHALTGATMDNPGAHCLGAGMPGSMLNSGGYPMEITQTADKLLVVYEAHSEIRRIYVDDTLPEDDRITERNGYSTGRWEGDTLVVETDHLQEQVDQTYAHSENARIVERYRLASDEDGTRLLIADWIMTDPDFYTAPVSGEKKWAFVPDGRVLNYECNEPIWEDHLQELRDAASSGSASDGE